MKHLKKLSLTLALLITTATGAWADSFSADAYTANATLNAVSVSTNQTVTINKGVTVTVNNGLTIQSNATLTITGGGTLVVNGTTGANGSNGYQDSNLDWNTGQTVWFYVNPTAGGPGGAAITINSGGQLALSNATVIANGGQGGQGGRGMNGADPFWAASGANGNGFSSFPTIEGAVMSYSTNGTDYTEYESGNTTLYRFMKVEPEVTISQDAETKQYEASFKMPQYDVTATYTIKRDMTVDVAGEMADRIRIQMVDNAFQAVDATQMNPVVKDNLETNSPVTLTVTTDYTLQLQKQSETNADEWTDATALSVGTFRYKITGTGNYSGICYSEEFALFEGYEIEVPAGEFATFYKDEPLYADTETSADAVLYTISSVSADKAVLSSAITTAPSLTPLLVFNSSEETKTFLLIPADAEPNLVLTVAPEFKGTLEATTIAASTDDQTNYALNGKQFVWVKNAVEIGANKAWLSVNTGEPSARITLVFDETTKIANTNITNITNGNWYDLNGRKLDGMPTKKGVYLFNGRKVVVK